MTNFQSAQLIEHLTDAFERSAGNLPAAKNATLAECVPLIAIALEFVSRGPASLTVDGVERYRAGAVKILEHMRPVIEREADLTFADWFHGSAAQPSMELRAAA
jgi:hypothetical protein